MIPWTTEALDLFYFELERVGLWPRPHQEVKKMTNFEKMKTRLLHHLQGMDGRAGKDEADFEQMLETVENAKTTQDLWDFIEANCTNPHYVWATLEEGEI